MAVAISLLAGVAFGLAMAAPPGPMNAVIAEESVRRGFPAGFRAGLGAMTGDAIFCVLAFVGVVEIVEHAPTLRAAMVGVGGCLMLVFAVDAAASVREREGHDDEGSGQNDGTAGEAERTGASAEPDGAGASAEPDGAGASAEPGDPGANAESEGAGLARSTGFRKALALSLTNPYQIVFWLTVGVGLLRAGSLDLVAQAAWLGDLLGALGFEESLVIETGSPALLVGFFGGIGAWITGYPATLVAVDRRSERAGPVVAGISALVLGGFGVLFLVDAATSLL